MEGPSIDEAEVEPRLYLIGPAGTPAGGPLSDELAAVLEQARPAAFLLRRCSLEAEQHDSVIELLRIARERDVAFLVEDQADIAVAIAADGVHLSSTADVQAIRRRLQRDQILGADVGLSRHDAMLAGDQGVDYVAFGQAGQPVDETVLDLVTWWRDLFVLPCLAFAGNALEARALAEAGTDFIGVSEAVWNHPENPATGARLLQDTIGRK